MAANLNIDWSSMPPSTSAFVSKALAPVVRAAALADDMLEENDSISAARNLGTLTTSTTVGSLVQADANDWYRFTTTSTGASTHSVAINFQHSQGDLDLRLYNSSGQLLRLSDSVSNAEQVSLSGLAAGTYYVRVYGYRGATNPSYALKVNVGQAAADDALEDNDTLATARSLGTLTAGSTTSNLIMADSGDWYRFAMNAAGASGDSVAISFQNAQGNLDLELYNAGGTRIGVSSGTTSSESISLAGLAAGMYTIRVFGAANPNYSLVVDPGAAAPPPPNTSSGFDIQFSFNGLTASQQAIFNQAAAKWESIIVGDLPNATYNGQVVDDLLIQASSAAIDGSGGVLGQAGPDRFRSGSQLPYHGVMEFDSADLASMERNGTLLGVILHEMGHVLGVGTLWTSKGLLVGAGTSNPRFVGQQAVAAYNAIFGRNESGVPVENGGGSGTRDSHWEESVFSSELMTGYIGPGNMALSRITVASLADIGYSVNIAAADPYSPPGTSSVVLASASSSGTQAASLRVADTSALAVALEIKDQIAAPLRRVWELVAEASADSPLGRDTKLPTEPWIRQAWEIATDQVFATGLKLGPKTDLWQSLGGSRALSLRHVS